jgi:hypothetical protein
MTEDDAQRAFTTSARRMHVSAIEFAVELAEPLHSAVLRALELVPKHRAPAVSMSSDSEWVTISQIPGPTLVVFRPTGAVFEVGEDGTVGEEPIA